MHRTTIVCAVIGLVATGCSAAPEGESESVGTEAQAIRDPLSTMCTYYTPCDELGNPIGPVPGGSGGGGEGGQGGGGGGAAGGSGEGGGSVGGGHGGGAAGGGGGAGEGGRWSDASDFARCEGACIGGAPAIAAFCGSIPVPQVQAICFANQFAGEVVCMGFCYAWFVAS